MTMPPASASSPQLRRPPAALLAVAALLGPAVAADRAGAAPPTFGPFDVQTVFFIDKSQNRNRVDFGVRLDESCRPVEVDPVFAYWRELERTPLRLSNLNPTERGVYGVDKQRVVRRDETGGELVVRMKKLDREVVIATRRTGDGRCESTARTRIAGIPDAVLQSAHVQLSSPLIVKYVEIHGVDPQRGEPVVERVTR